MDENMNIEAVSWESHTYFMGFDWAKDHHEIVVVNRDSRGEKSLGLVLGVMSTESLSPQVGIDWEPVCLTECIESLLVVRRFR